MKTIKPGDIGVEKYESILRHGFIDDDPNKIFGWSGDQKKLFRGRKAWKEFRDREIKARGCRCELCEGDYKGKSEKLDLHHLDEAHYDDLNPEKFKSLCFYCHDFTEFFIKRMGSPKFRTGPNFIAIYTALRPFLSLTVRFKGDNLLEVMTGKVKN
jgi:hypothetical protein